ncbi:hypothetical protein NKH98_21025 [Mesorhizobium sp. M0833]|uniref:type II toxin-antitoxin system Phd/YefM family antitoxin n=1 Tax=Mesorhizobium sp. M0833 TaxID=2957009 RepID=UPI003334B65C
MINYDLNYGHKGSSHECFYCRSQGQIVGTRQPRGSGEEIVLTRHGKVAARIVAPAVAEPLPRIGALKGKIWIADDFDELGPEWDEYVK